MKRILFIVIILILSIACQKKPTFKHPVKFSGLKVKKIEIIDMKTFEGFPIGVDFSKGETYIKSDITAKRKFSIQIVDLKSGAVKKTIELNAGDFQSPTEFFSPVHFAPVGDRVYIVDQYEKIVVFDSSLSHLYSSMFHQIRFFIDFFNRDEKTYFVIGTKKTAMSIKSDIQLYQLVKGQKPIFIKDIYTGFEIPHIFAMYRNIGNDYYKGIFWPAIFGFEKDGKVYFSNSGEQMIHVYDLVTEKEESIGLSYLNPRKYTDTEANKMGYYKSSGEEEKYSKQTHGKIVYKAFPSAVNHFGIYDVGEGKIGIATNIDLEKMTFRMDIIDSTSYEYKMSISLPVDISFQASISTPYGGFSKGCLNIDQGIYVGYDVMGKDFVDTTKIIKFKIKEQ